MDYGELDRMQNKRNLSNNLNMLRDYLNSPETLSQLLERDFCTTPQSLLKNSCWTRLPQFYHALLPRVSYRVDWDNGPTILIKLNAIVEKISREGKVCRFLHQCYPRFHTVPLVLDMECEACTSDGMTCGWLATKWCNGFQLPEIHEADIIRRTAEALADFHLLPLDFKLAKKLFDVHEQIPSPKVIAQHIREKQLIEIQEFIETAHHELSLLLEKLQSWLYAHALDENLRLTHGDFHLHNVLVKSNEERKLSRLVIFDWEDATVNNPLDDVAHLIVTDGVKIGSYFIDSYINAMKNQSSKICVEEVKKTIWLLSGVWCVRLLKDKRASVKKEDEDVQIDQELMKILETISDKMGEL